MEVLDEGAKIPRGSMGVWTLAWPSIITNLFYATSSIVAIKVVGNLGPDAIAAAVEASWIGPAAAAKRAFRHSDGRHQNFL